MEAETPEADPDPHEDDLRDLVTSSVERRPWVTLGVSLALGFVLGRMLR